MAAEKRQAHWVRDALPVGLLVGAACAFWWRLLLLRGYLVLDDMGLYHVPTATIYARALAQGRLPLWCEAMGAGYPLYAEGQIGALYPPNLVLFWLFSPLTALNVGAVLHVAMAAVFTYVLGRQMRLSRSAATLAGLTFSLASVMAVYATCTNIIRVVAWLPLLLVCVGRAVESDRPWRWVPAIGGVSAMQWLAGHPQMTLFSLAVVVWHAVFGGLAERRGRSGRALVGMGAVAAGLAAGAALAAAQILPTAGLYPLASREFQHTVSSRLSELMPVRHLATFLLPTVFGSPQAGTFAGPVWLFNLWSCYLGGVALVLAALTVRLRAPWRVGCWLTLAAAALAVTVLPYPVLVFSHLPFLAGLRFWPRALWVLALAVSLLAGAGLDLALGSPRLARRAQAACLGLGAVVAVIGGAALASPWWTPGRPPGFAGAVLYFRQAEPWLVVGVLTAAGGVLWLHRLQRVSRLGAAGALVALNAVLLFHFGQLYQPLVERSFYTRPPWTAAAAADPGLRVFSRYVPQAADRRMFGAHREALSKDWPLLYGLRSLQGYSALPLLRPALFTSTLIEAKPSPEAPIWRVTNTGHIVTSRYADSPTGRTMVEGVAAPAPRVWVAERVIRVESPFEALGLLAVRNIAEGATVEAPPATRLPEGLPKGSARARVTRAADMEVEVETDSPRAGLLVLADAWCPGWHALVNGREAPIWPANCMFRGVAVPSGHSRVRFVYEPVGVRLGLWITLLALAAAAGWGGWAAVTARGPGRRGQRGYPAAQRSNADAKI